MDKILYKITILSLKLIPWVLAIIYIIGTVFASLGIDLLILSAIGFTSIIPLIFIILSSFTFKFCFWHRAPLYFILFDNIINWTAWSILGTMPFGLTVIILLLSFGSISIIGAYLKNKRNEQIRDFKNNSATDNK